MELNLITEKDKNELFIETNKGMYGSVDEAISWMKDFAKTVTVKFERRLTQGNVDPCMFFVKGKELEMVVVIHVDDMVIAGKKDTVKTFKEELGEHYTIKDLGVLSSHLGVNYEWLRDKKGEKYLSASMDKYAIDIVDT